jgi:flagellar protein FliS
MNAALRQYQQVGVAGTAMDGDPRKLISMLLAGAIDRLMQARSSVMSRDTRSKHHCISATISIIEHLRVVLDLEAGGELAANLMRLYDYMLGRLPAANVADDIKPLDEVAALLRTIKSAWDAIPADATRH